MELENNLIAIAENISSINEVAKLIDSELYELNIPSQDLNKISGLTRCLQQTADTTSNKLSTIITNGDFKNGD